MSSSGSVSILSCEFCYKVSKAQYLSCRHVMCKRCMDKIITGDVKIECPICMVITYTQDLTGSAINAVNEPETFSKTTSQGYKDRDIDRGIKNIESNQYMPTDIGILDFSSRDSNSGPEHVNRKQSSDISIGRDLTDSNSYVDKPTVNSYRHGYQIFVDKPKSHADSNKRQDQSTANQLSHNKYIQQQHAYVGSSNNTPTQSLRHTNSRRSSLSRGSRKQSTTDEIPPELQEILMSYQSKSIKPGFNRTILVNTFDGDQSTGYQDSLSDSPFDESLDSNRSLRYQFVDCSQEEDPFVQNSTQAMYEAKLRNSIALEQIKEDLEISAAKLLKKHQSVLTEINRLTKTEDNAMKNINKLEAMFIQDIQKHHEQLRKSVHYKKEASRLKYKQFENDINNTIKDVHSKTVKVNHVINNTEDHSINEISTIKEISERTLSTVQLILNGTPTDSTFIVDITPGEPFDVDRSTKVEFIYPNLGQHVSHTENIRQPLRNMRSSSDSTDLYRKPVSNKEQTSHPRGTIEQYRSPNVTKQEARPTVYQNNYSNSHSFSNIQNHEQSQKQYTDSNTHMASQNSMDNKRYVDNTTTVTYSGNSFNKTVDKNDLLPLPQRHQITIKGPSMGHAENTVDVQQKSKPNTANSVMQKQNHEHDNNHLQEAKKRKSGFHAIELLQNSNPIQHHTMREPRRKSESKEPLVATMPLPILPNEHADERNTKYRNMSPSEENKVTENGTRSHEVISHMLPYDSKREQQLNRLNRTTNDILPTPLTIPSKSMMNTLPDRVRSQQEANGTPMVFARRRKSTAEILTPTSKSTFETVIYPELADSKIKLEHSVHGLNSRLSCGSPLEVCDNGYKRVWNIKGYSLSTLKREYSSHGTRLEHISSINCVTETPAGFFIVGEENSLNIYDNKGQHVQKIIDGHFSSAVIIENKLHAFDWQECKLFTLTQYWNNTWKLVGERQFSLDRPCLHDRCVVTNEHIYISAFNDHCIYKYDSEGQIISKFGQKVGSEYYNCHTYYPDIEPGLLYYPYLCNVDCDGNMLIADSGNHRLQVCSKDGQWSVLRLDGNISASFFPCFALANENNLYVLSIQFNKHYHNRQSDSGCHDTCSKTFVINMYEKQTPMKLLQ